MLRVEFNRNLEIYLRHPVSERVPLTKKVWEPRRQKCWFGSSRPQWERERTEQTASERNGELLTQSQHVRFQCFLIHAIRFAERKLDGKQREPVEGEQQPIRNSKHRSEHDRATFHLYLWKERIDFFRPLASSRWRQYAQLFIHKPSDAGQIPWTFSSKSLFWVDLRSEIKC